MKKIGILLLQIAAAGLTLSAFANETKKQTYEFEGTDITAFVEYFRPAVKTLRKSVTVYNWSSSSNSEFWSVPQKPNDQSLVSFAQRLSESFWENYGRTENRGDMYGFGLYAALDPAVTRSYGSAGSEWVLLQMQLPAGFKMIDMRDTLEGSSLKVRQDQALEISKKFQCSAITFDISLDSLFTQGGKAVKPDCQRLVRKVFKDILKIDGFVYSYSETTYGVCSYNLNSHRAFVITSPRWMNSENINFYSSKTTENEPERIRIQTLILKAIGTSGEQADPKSKILAKITSYIKAKPESYVAGSSTKCEKDTCVIKVNFCDTVSKVCEDVNLDPIPRPGGGLITAREALGTFGGRLLWSDLEGKPKETTIDTWIKENKYACSNESPFVADEKKVSP